MATLVDRTGTRGMGDARGAGAAGRLIVTLMGDYWYANSGFIASSALVDLVTAFGMTEAAARAALSRLSRDGVLERTRSGRTTAYRLSPARAEGAERAGRELMQFAAAPTAWDGQWTCVVVSAPGADGRRRAVRRRLRRLGLGALSDEVWITPRPLVGPIRRAVAGLEDGEVAVFRATEVEVPHGADLTAAWDIAGLRAGYDALAAALEPMERRIDDGSMGAAEALLARTGLLDRWRDLVSVDPRLPDELLPDDWPRDAVRRAFVRAYDALGPLAELRVRQVVGERVGPGGQPCHHRVADIV
jgi:phenylacetic acid degradation operon negative regulatory protein